MSCPGFPTFQGCGKCIVSIDNDSIVSEIDARYIIDIVCKLHKNSRQVNKVISVVTTTITCKGSMSIGYYDSRIREPDRGFNEQYLDGSGSTASINRTQLMCILTRWINSNIELVCDSCSAVYMLMTIFNHRREECTNDIIRIGDWIKYINLELTQSNKIQDDIGYKISELWNTDELLVETID